MMLSSALSSLISANMLRPVAVATGETIAMVLVSLVFAELIGTPLGILLVLTGPGDWPGTMAFIPS